MMFPEKIIVQKDGYLKIGRMTAKRKANIARVNYRKQDAIE